MTPTTTIATTTTNAAIRTTGRLETIAARQSKSWLRDVFFTACVALAAAVSIASVSTASRAASTSQLTQR